MRQDFSRNDFGSELAMGTAEPFLQLRCSPGLVLANLPSRLATPKSV